MTGPALWKWAKLERGRWRKSQGRLRTFSHPWILSLLASVIFAGESARRVALSLDVDSQTHLVQSMQPLWAAALVLAVIGMIFGTPSLLYWQKDSGLKSRLAISGKAHLYVALRRGLERMAILTLPLLSSSLVYGVISGDGVGALKQGAVILAVMLSAFALGFAASVLAGLVVASDKVQSAIASFGGEFEAPKTSWLGILPGLSATLCAAVALGSSSWSLTGQSALGRIEFLIVPTFVFSIASLTWAWRTSETTLPQAIREVAALDREILAHVERSTPSRLESIAARLGLAGANARTLFAKDATLMRRRYPMPYFIFPCGIAALWILLLMRPEQLDVFAASLVIGLGLYSMILARRLWLPPVEYPTFLATLPFERSESKHAKNVAVGLRLGLVFALGALPWLIVSETKVFALSSVLVALTIGFLFPQRRLQRRLR